ncbi:MAG: hypothetical protein AAF734_05050 [Bacteroidota bacterium]
MATYYIVGLSVDQSAIKSLSGLYITDLEGINEARLLKLSDLEQENFVTLFEAIYKRSESHIKADLETLLQALLQEVCEGEKRPLTVESFLTEHQASNLLAQVYLAKLGEELMRERTNSARINDYTIVTRDQAKEMKLHYKGRYEKRLKQLVKTYLRPSKVSSYYYRADLP